MRKAGRIGAALGLAIGLAGLAWLLLRPVAMLSEAELQNRYAQPLPMLAGRPPVYHLGNEATGRVMPQLLAGFAAHNWHSQLGREATLLDHRENHVPDFEEMNPPPFFRPAGEALGSGDYPVVVVSTTHEGADEPAEAAALAYWAALARNANPEARVYHYLPVRNPLDDPEWQARVAEDHRALWEPLLRRAMADPAAGTIHVIPAAEALAAAAAAADAGAFADIPDSAAFFDEEGGLSDLGAYVVALVHYAVIQSRPPHGLPHEVWLFEGRYAAAPSDAAARALQDLVWQEVANDPQTGVTVPGAETAQQGAVQQ